MFVAVVEFSLHDGHMEAFLERVRRQAEDSLGREPGCHVFDVCIDPERQNFVLLYEVYADRAAFDAHLASAHYAAFDAEVSDSIIDKRVTFFDRI